MHVRQIDCNPTAVCLTSQKFQFIQCFFDSPVFRKDLSGFFQYIDVTVHIRQCQKSVAGIFMKTFCQLGQSRHILGFQKIEQLCLEYLGKRIGRNQGFQDTDVGEIQTDAGNIGRFKGCQSQILNFSIGFNTRIAENFSADLQGLACTL